MWDAWGCSYQSAECQNLDNIVSAGFKLLYSNCVNIQTRRWISVSVFEKKSRLNKSAFISGKIQFPSYPQTVSYFLIIFLNLTLSLDPDSWQHPLSNHVISIWYLFYEDLYSISLGFPEHTATLVKLGEIKEQIRNPKLTWEENSSFIVKSTTKTVFIAVFCSHCVCTSSTVFAKSQVSTAPVITSVIQVFGAYYDIRLKLALD